MIKREDGAKITYDGLVELYEQAKAERDRYRMAMEVARDLLTELREATIEVDTGRREGDGRVCVIEDRVEEIDAWIGLHFPMEAK